MSKIVNLIIVAHPDDEILGFGATGAMLVEKGEIVQPVILCGHVDQRTLRPSNQELYNDMVSANHELGFLTPILGNFPNIRMNTVDHIEIVQFIEKQIENFQPTRIFTHHPRDLNDDHTQISKACMVATRLFQRRADIKPIESLSLIEIPSSTDWAFDAVVAPFIANNFVEVGEDLIEKKIKALSFYKGVMRPYPHPRSEEVIKGLAAYRGGQSGCNYAEAFQTIFKVGF